MTPLKTKLQVLSGKYEPCCPQYCNDNEQAHVMIPLAKAARALGKAPGAGLGRVAYDSARRTHLKALMPTMSTSTAAPMAAIGAA